MKAPLVEWRSQECLARRRDQAAHREKLPAALAAEAVELVELEAEPREGAAREGAATVSPA